MAGKFRGNVGRVSKPKVSTSTKKSRAKHTAALVKRSRKLPEASLLSRLAQLTGGATTVSSATKPLHLRRRSQHLVGGAAPVLEKTIGRAAMEVVAPYDPFLEPEAQGNNPSTFPLRAKKKEKLLAVKPPLNRAASKASRAVPASSSSSAHTAEEGLAEAPDSSSGDENMRHRTTPQRLNNIKMHGKSFPEGSPEEEEEEEEEEERPVANFPSRERVVPTSRVADPSQLRTTAEAVGLRLLHQAIKTQGHNRLLPFQQRHDYEYRLRQVATLGVVQLFRSLAVARKAGERVAVHPNGSDDDMDDLGRRRVDHGKVMTEDKMRERKEIVSKEAFLSALRKGPLERKLSNRSH